MRLPTPSFHIEITRIQSDRLGKPLFGASHGPCLDFRRLLINAHLLRFPDPSSLRRTIKYASFLRISGALHLSIFEQPAKNDHSMLTVMGNLVKFCKFRLGIGAWLLRVHKVGQKFLRVVRPGGLQESRHENPKTSTKNWPQNTVFSVTRYGVYPIYFLQNLYYP